MAYLTLEQKQEELEALVDFLEDIDIAAEVMDAPEEEDDKLILVEFPGGDGPAKTPEELERVLVGRIMQTPDEDEVYTKYLLLYTQVAVDVADKDELAVLRLVNDLNRTALVGSFFYSKEALDDECKIQYKVMIPSADDVPFDEGVVGETIINCGIMYDEAKEAFEKL